MISLNDQGYYKKYQIGTLWWIGPDVPCEFTKSTFTDEERREALNNSLSYQRDEDHPITKKYVLLSQYLGCDGETIMGPDDFLCCYEELLNILRTELQRYPQDENVIRTCLQCHWINGVTFAE